MSLIIKLPPLSHYRHQCKDLLKHSLGASVSFFNCDNNNCDKACLLDFALVQREAECESRLAGQGRMLQTERGSSEPQAALRWLWHHGPLGNNSL